MLRDYWAILLAGFLVSVPVFAQDATVVLEPDHSFVFVSEGAPEASILLDAGINRDEGDPFQTNGVSIISFTFENYYLELGWVHDQETFREDWYWWDETWQYRPVWRESGASPFLLGFHRADPKRTGLPFQSAEEVNFYEDGGWVKHGIHEWPHVFVMGPRGAMPDPWWMTPEIKERSRNHPSGMRRLTGLRLTTTRSPDHDVFRVLDEQGALEARLAQGHVLELTFDEHRQGKCFDARPKLPLIFYY